MMDYQELKKRRKLVWLRPDFLRSWINGTFLKHDCVSFPVIEGSEGAAIYDIFWSDQRLAFGVILLREDFPEHPEGEMIPDFMGKMEFRTVKLPIYGEHR
jgi:hypothetical protein